MKTKLFIFILLSVGLTSCSLFYPLNTQVDEFKHTMKASRDARLRQGALSWSLFEDAEKEGMLVEHFVFETWADYLRRFDRFTLNDLRLLEERQQFHIGPEPPKIIRRVAATLHT